jgi:hypothetical protein
MVVKIVGRHGSSVLRHAKWDPRLASCASAEFGIMVFFPGLAERYPGGPYLNPAEQERCFESFWMMYAGPCSAQTLHTALANDKSDCRWMASITCSHR